MARNALIRRKIKGADGRQKAFPLPSPSSSEQMLDPQAAVSTGPLKLANPPKAGIRSTFTHSRSRALNHGRPHLIASNISV